MPCLSFYSTHKYFQFVNTKLQSTNVKCKYTVKPPNNGHFGTNTVYVGYFTRIIIILFQFINVHVTLISRIIHVYGIHVYSGKDLDAFKFAKSKIKVTLKLS